ncbi:hypothetical protein [Microbacterium sp. Gd 4-13]|uniref:hypothetical protein n=1 Tax=Microbacterium sp. Gd 4-13 TaxID=2173179 RepID=UPI00197C1A05|nr:hypothetical protein [Microbacterium sp. Gd 4-13]
MSGPTPRRRKHSPAVYRRRRLVVLLTALIVVAGLVWLFIAQPWQSSASTETLPVPSSSSSSSPPSSSTSESAAPEADAETPVPEADAEEPAPDLTPSAEPCIAADLLIEAVTDQAVYAAGQNPQLSIRLTNQSTTDCTLNVGTSAQAFTISSGPDIWWRSTDCQTEPSDMTVLLSAGQQVTSATPLTWDRTRSSVDTCQGDRPPAAGGGATYRLSVAIGGLSSSNTAAFQLN